MRHWLRPILPHIDTICHLDSILEIHTGEKDWRDRFLVLWYMSGIPRSFLHTPHEPLYHCFQFGNIHLDKIRSLDRSSKPAMVWRVYFVRWDDSAHPPPLHIAQVHSLCLTQLSLDTKIIHPIHSTNRLFESSSLHTTNVQENDAQTTCQC